MIEVHIGSSRSNFKSQVEVKSEVDVDWRRNWISSLYLSVQSGTVELQEEYLVYDFQVHYTEFSFHGFMNTKGTYLNTFLTYKICRTSSVIWGAILDFY